MQVGGEAGGTLVFGSPFGYGQSLYGTADSGGAGYPPTVFRLTPPHAAGDAWTETILYTFGGESQGSIFGGSLAVDAAGRLFGVTTDGGYVGGFCRYWGGCGTVFSLTPPAAAGGPWTYGIVHAFNPADGDGNQPCGGLIMGTGGVLYGTTLAGGEGYEGGGVGGGQVFSLTPAAVPGGPMTETILHSFGVAEGDGNTPSGSLTEGPNGELYGTTEYGGATGSGTVFELTPPASAGGSWAETILYSFPPEVLVVTGLTLGPDGTLYGTIFANGSSGGAVFALKP